MDCELARWEELFVFLRRRTGRGPLDTGPLSLLNVFMICRTSYNRRERRLCVVLCGNKHLSLFEPNVHTSLVMSWTSKSLLFSAILRSI